MSRKISRRDLLRRSYLGLGGLALLDLMSRSSARAASLSSDNPMAVRPQQVPAKAKRCIFLFMEGGPSHIDTFDPKPLLDKYDGQDPAKLFTVEPTQFNNNGTVLASPWKFKQHGESGIPVSELFPHVAECVDELAIVRSLTSGFPEHTFANYFLHTGSALQGRPSMGAWVNYGLGSECQNLPGFVALSPSAGSSQLSAAMSPPRSRFGLSIAKPAGSGSETISLASASLNGVTSITVTSRVPTGTSGPVLTPSIE